MACKVTCGASADPLELRQLIRRLAAENLPWGEERIANELLLKLGLRVSPRTVRKYMSRHPPRLPRGDQRWSTFLRNPAIVACDFFLIVTASFRQLYVFVMIEHESRRLVHMNVTPHPYECPQFQYPAARISTNRLRDGWRRASSRSRCISSVTTSRWVAPSRHHCAARHFVGVNGQSRLKNLDAVFGTPLPQRAFDGVGFKRKPGFKTAFALQQILEARVSALPSEKSFDLIVTRRQFLCDKAQGETSPEIEIVLMRYRKVAIRSFKVVRNILVEGIVGIRCPIDLARIERDIRVVLHRRRVVNEVEGHRKIVEFDCDHGSTPIGCNVRVGRAGRYPAPPFRRPPKSG
ncbi:Tranposase [Paraburkholderia hospita]|uniref:Tranposase n=1 Tax=Paraburkholderia hospita TaxID=169430 RepID=A0ABP2P9U0_9BURK|nr:Tranposase [Paraburkholderia hospita]